MKYSGLDQSLLQSFKGCHDRVRDGKCPSIQWPRTREGYIAFCAEIGPKPKGMVKPSVGRKNHKKGYVKGNVRWEEHRFNSVKRRGTRHENSKRKVVKLKMVKFKRGTAEHLEHQRRIAQRYWRLTFSRLQQSKTLKALWKAGAFDDRKPMRRKQCA